MCEKNIEMPPRSTTVTYGPLDPAPEQTRFSHRRKIVKQPAVLPPLPRHQSTLTQVGWIDTPSSNHSRKAGTIDSFSDAEDGEYYVPEPRSKAQPITKTRSSKKRLEKTESQPSFTQAVRSAPARMANRAREMDDQGFQIWHDPDDPADTPIERMLKRRKRHGELKMLSTDAVGLYGDEYESRRGTRWRSPEIAEGSQLPVNRDDGDGLAGEEIPSSQSPASVQLSTQRSQRFVDVERTPLRTKDANARSPIKQPQFQNLEAGDESQMFARKMLMSMETQPQDRFSVRFEREEDEATPKPQPKSTPTLVRVTTVPDSTDTEDDDEIVKQDTERPPRTLKRVGTVQESQSELGRDEDESGGEEARDMCIVTKADQRAVIDQVPSMPPPKPRPRKLKRVLTVQDSQCDDADLELLDGPTEQGYDGMAEVEGLGNINRVSTEIDQSSVAKLEEDGNAEYDSAMKEGKLERRDADADAAEEIVEEKVAENERAEEKIAEGTAESESSEAEEEAGEQEFYEDATYDPAYSALDRDAARFALITQTQGLRPKQQDSNEGRHDNHSQEVINEEHCHDRDPDGEEYTAANQLSQELRYAAEAVVPSSQPAERTENVTTTVKDSQPSARDTTFLERGTNNHVSAAAREDAVREDEERVPSSPPPVHLAKPSLAVAREAKVVLQPDSPGVLQQEEERVPSSPPSLRASQVSTVVPTQYSLARPSSRRAGATQTQWSFRSPLKTTRWRSQEEMMTMGSSSPVQLPPWSSPERARYADRMTARGGTGELVMGSMMDFSLPPPPPISSSRAGTQSGGRSSPALPM
ncbi:hypothetical protein LTR74_000631 [Friedmanniomyces endolithicus]|nr:hypothetical protein LTR74_000631 [Friedmanniomyces endolithicus]